MWPCAVEFKATINLRVSYCTWTFYTQKKSPSRRWFPNSALKEVSSKEKICHDKVDDTSNARSIPISEGNRTGQEHPSQDRLLILSLKANFTFQKWQHLNVSWIPGIPRPASQSPVLNRQHVLQRCQTLSTVRILSANCGVLYKENMFSDFPPSIVDPSVSALISAVWVVRRLRLGWAAKTENMPRVHTVKLSTVQWVCPCVIQG